jgi:hypothetical protein
MASRQVAKTAIHTVKPGPETFKAVSKDRAPGARGAPGAATAGRLERDGTARS